MSQAAGASREIHHSIWPKIFVRRVADVERHILVIGRDQEIRVRQALQTGDLEPQVAMRHHGDLVIESFALRGGRIHEENGTGCDGGDHGIAMEVHGDHVLGVGTPGQRSQPVSSTLTSDRLTFSFGGTESPSSSHAEQRNGHSPGFSSN